MDANVKATPRAILNGIADGSGRDISSVEERLPGHLPLLFVMSQRGPDTVEYIEYDAPARIYGSKTFVEGSEYFTHQTNLLKRFLDNGNAVMVQRIIPPNATKAMIRLSVELIPTELPEYIFNADGTIQYGLDEHGYSKPRVKGTFIGTRVIWHASINPEGVYPTNDQLYRQGKVVPAFRGADVVAVDSTHLSTIETATSTLYPIMDIQIRDFGKFGNKIGLYISDITSDGIEALNQMSNINDFLYRIKVVELDETNLPVLRRTASGDTSTTVSLSNDSYDPVTGFNYSISSLLGEKYQVLKDIHIYQTNLKEVTDKLISGYSQDGIEVIGESSDSYNESDYLLLNGKVNIFHGTDTQGQLYKTFTVADSYKFLGVDLSKDYILGEGGNDGLVVKATGEHDVLANLEIFDKAVKNYLTNWAVDNALLQDPAKNPFTTLWDSGFSLETKKAFAVPMSMRSDIWSVISTFMVADYVGPVIEIKEPQRSWMTLMGLNYIEVEVPENNETGIVPIAADKLQMGITGVTNGYVINGITAKDAGDNWNVIPLVGLIKPQDVSALRVLADTSPDAVVIKSSSGAPLYTVSQLLSLETDELGNFKYPITIPRSNPNGSITLILDWDGSLNSDYFTNTWSVNWNILIQEPDPVSSPVTFGGLSNYKDTNYLKAEDYIETVNYLSEQELNLNIVNKPSAGWYWKYIQLNAVIADDFITTITKQAANGLESAIVTVDHNGVKTNYRAGEVITLNTDSEGNLLIPLLLNKEKPVGIINILADYDGNDGRRYYQSPLKINYNIDVVNPPQQVSTIQFVGFDRTYEVVKDSEYLDPKHGRLTEQTPPAGVDQLIKITNVVEAGWYWNKIRVYAMITAADAAAMMSAYESGYEGIVLSIKQNGVLIRTSTAAQLATLTKDSNGNIIVPLEINRNQPTGQFVFDMNWDATHLDYVAGKRVVEYQLTPVNPVPLKSWVTYQGIDSTGITLPDSGNVEIPGEWYKDLRIENLTSTTAIQELSLSSDKYTNVITSKVEAGWYWDHATVYFTIAKDALDLIKLATTKEHVGNVLTLTTPWRNYTYSSAEILALETNNGTAWLSIDIPRIYPSGKITANVDWDLGNYPEATSTVIDINYTLNNVNPSQTLSIVKWGGVDNSYPNVTDATYLRPDSYIENVIITPTGYNVTIENGASAGWYWNKIHTVLVIAAKDVDAMRNAVYNEFTVGNLVINHNETLTELSLANILLLNKDASGNYLYPVSLDRTVTEGYIKVTADWDGDHKDYLNNTTVINYTLDAIDPNPLESTITYRGVKSLREATTLVVNAPGVINSTYLTETFTGTPDGYTVKLVTNPDAGWYWTQVQTYLAVAPDVLVFLQSLVDKGHTGKVLTLVNGTYEESYTTQQILDLEKDTDGAALIPYIIPRTLPIGTILATVDWDTVGYPEANANTIRIAYNIEIHDPVQTVSEMRYFGIDNTLTYETNGEYLVPTLAIENITNSFNNYRSVITVGEDAGWYWNKVNVAATITATDLEVIRLAKEAGYSGTVLSAYHNGSIVHSLTADDILALRQDTNGNALVPFVLSSDIIDGEITAVIDWDVNHLDYTQSTWRFTYRLEIRRPGMVTPTFSVEEEFTTIYDDRFPATTYKFTASGSNATVSLLDVYPETADKVGLRYKLDSDSSNYIVSLAAIDPNLVILRNGLDGLDYTAQQLADLIVAQGNGRLEFYVPASKLISNRNITMNLDLDGQNTIYQPTDHILRYSYTNPALGASSLTATYVDSTYVPNFVKGWQTGNTINMVLTSPAINTNKYRVEFMIDGAEWGLFQKARQLGMPDNTVVLTMLLTGTNATITCTASQLESMVYLDDFNQAYFTQDFDITHGDIQFNFHWTKGFGGYTAGSMKLTMNLLVLVEQSLNVVNYTYDQNYGDNIIPNTEYVATVSNAESGISSNVVMTLDNNYPTDRPNIRLAITFPVAVSNRIMELINTAPNTPVFRDNTTGQTLMAIDFTTLIKDVDKFIYPVYVSVGNASGVLNYTLSLNALGEDLYTDYNYTVNYAVNKGAGLTPTLVPVLVVDDITYTAANVTHSGNNYTLAVECTDSLVPAFNIDLLIPKAYHGLILESIENNPNEIIISGDNLVVYAKDFVGLETNENGDKVIRNYTITPNPDDVLPDDPTTVISNHTFNLSYTPNYSGANPTDVNYSVVINVIAMEISCETATPSTYAEFSGDLNTTLFDVQLDGVYHKNISYTRLVELCTASGIEVIPFGIKIDDVEVPVTINESTLMRFSGNWIPEVNGIQLSNVPVSSEEAIALLAEHGIEFVSEEPADCELSESTTPEFGLNGLFTVKVNGELLTNEPVDLETLKTLLNDKDVELTIVKNEFIDIDPEPEVQAICEASVSETPVFGLDGTFMVKVDGQLITAAPADLENIKTVLAAEGLDMSIIGVEDTTTDPSCSRTASMTPFIELDGLFNAKIDGEYVSTEPVDIDTLRTLLEAKGIDVIYEGEE